MGWAGGSELMNVIIVAAQKHIDDDKARKKFYKPIIEEFVSHDWDTMDESLDIDEVFDALIKKMYPDDFSDSGDDEEEYDGDDE